MEELIQYLGQNLVDHPDDFEIEATTDGDYDSYTLRAHQDDLGQLIGRHGRTVRAIRTLVRAVAARDGQHAKVEVVD